MDELKTRSPLKKAAIVRELDESLNKAYGGTFKETLWALALQSRRLIGAHQSACSYIPNGDFKQAIHTHSFSEKYEKYNSYDVMPTGGGIWGCVVKSKTPIRMTDEALKHHAHWKNFSGLKDARGLEHPPMIGWLAVPVKRLNGDFIGVLQLSDKIEGDFTEEDEEALHHFSRVAGLTFDLYYTNNELSDNVAQLEQYKKTLITLSDRILTTREEERKRIAQELHDNIGQLLASQRFVIDNLKKKSAEKSQISHKKITFILSITDKMIQTIRDISHALYPSVLDNLGLLDAIEVELSQINRHSTLEFLLTSHHIPNSLPDTIQIHYFRIFQEAITNILRHSQATEATIVLKYSQNVLSMCITDNGIGITLDDWNNKSIGIISMKERMRSLDGHFHICNHDRPPFVTPS